MAKRKRLRPITQSGPALSGEDDASARANWGPGIGLRAPVADVSRDAAQHSALEEVADELRAARVEGRMVLKLSLEAIDATYLVRDRVASDADAMAELVESIRARGQQAPVEVVELGGGRYGLISGWRRLQALKQLHAQTQDPGFAVVQALVRTPDTAADAYRAMVEENEVRADLSFYERARIAVKAVEMGVYADVKTAIQTLFATARPAKRSKIAAFVEIVETLEDDLRFPTAIPEKVGLELAKALKSDPDTVSRLRAALKQDIIKTEQDERTVLDRVLRKKPEPKRVAAAQTVAPGLKLSATSGRVVLSGRGVDAALIEGLRNWLSDRNG